MPTQQQSAERTLPPSISETLLHISTSSTQNTIHFHSMWGMWSQTYIYHANTSTIESMIIMHTFTWLHTFALWRRPMCLFGECVCVPPTDIVSWRLGISSTVRLCIHSTVHMLFYTFRRTHVNISCKHFDIICKLPQWVSECGGEFMTPHPLPPPSIHRHSCFVQL